LSKTPFGAFRQFFAVCCAHNLYAFGVQIPHLQPEMYFASGTRPDVKCFRLYFLLAQKTLRGFFDSLCLPIRGGFFLLKIKFKNEQNGLDKRVSSCYTKIVQKRTKWRT